MAKEVIEGFLVQKQEVEEGRTREPENLGIAFTEYDAQEIIERDSEWMKDQPFDFGRSKTEKGIMYASHHRNERTYYVISKCEVIKEDKFNITGV